MNLKRHLRFAGLSALCGLLSGLAASVFLISLEWATNYRSSNPYIIWGLPLAGLFIGWMYHRFGKGIASGNNLILDEIHEPKATIPIHMAPFILIGTLLTHLFGGSAGREGTAVQMSGALSDQVSRIFNLSNEERKILLVAGTGAGFGAAIGAPFAGVLFGMEVIRSGRLKVFAGLECLIASFVAYYTAVLFGAPHSQFPKVEILDFQIVSFVYVGLAALAFGLAARAFIVFVHLIEGLINGSVSYPPLKPFVGGLILVGLFYLEGTYNYVGLGIPVIQDSFQSVSGFEQPILKSFFTGLTLASGFKGGEFIPLVFIGATFGSALSIFLPIGVSLLSALGFASVFGAAAKTPIACAVMAMEIFGFKIGLFAFLSCLISSFVSGTKGIYKSQRPG